MCPRKDGRWKIIILIGSIHFTATICVALQAPFYPKEAEKKGVTATVHGLVFGIFELVSFIACPIFGKYLDLLGAKGVLTGGALLNGLSCVAFGMLDMIDDYKQFVVLSFVLRSLEGIGASAIFTAVFATAVTKYPDKVATTFATLEIFYGLGYIVGPTVGGFLYQMGGYKLPFVAMGGLLIFASLMTGTFLEKSPKSGQKSSMTRLMVSPGVVLNAFVTLATAITMGFYSAALEPHLRQFDLSPSEIGGMFVISGSLYAILALPVGKIVDHHIDAKTFVIIGALLCTIGVCLVGPAAFIPTKPSIFYCVLGLICHGIGISCLMPPTFADSIASAVRDGFPNDMTTHALVSSFWASAFALGAFVGPSVTGYLLDTVGFRTASYLIIAANISVVMAEIIFILCRSKRCKLDQSSSDITASPIMIRRQETDSCSVSVTAFVSHKRYNSYLANSSTKMPNRQCQYDTFTRPISVSITAQASY